LALAAAALALGIGAASAEGMKVRIATEGAYPPFNQKNADGSLSGFDVDIANALCEKMKAQCTIVAQDWDGIIPGLLAKKYDAIIASMSITDERKKTIDFSDKYYNTPARFIVGKTSGITDVSPEGLKGKTIGAQSSTIHANYLEAKYKAGSTLKLYSTQDEANADLAAGRLDAILADSIVELDFLNKKDGACCQFAGPDFKDPEFFGSGAGIGLRKEDTKLKEAFNAAIKEIIADGTYKKINDKYFPFSIY
jgi:polar amino acid transport system substrate-binding protein